MIRVSLGSFKKNTSTAIGPSTVRFESTASSTCPETVNTEPAATSVDNGFKSIRLDTWTVKLDKLSFPSQRPALSAVKLSDISSGAETKRL